MNEKIKYAVSSEGDGGCVSGDHQRTPALHREQSSAKAVDLYGPAQERRKIKRYVPSLKTQLY